MSHELPIKTKTHLLNLYNSKPLQTQTIFFCTTEIETLVEIACVAQLCGYNEAASLQQAKEVIKTGSVHRAGRTRVLDEKLRPQRSDTD